MSMSLEHRLWSAAERKDTSLHMLGPTGATLVVTDLYAVTQLTTGKGLRP